MICRVEGRGGCVQDEIPEWPVKEWSNELSRKNGTR